MVGPIRRFLSVGILIAASAAGMDKARLETRVDEAIRKFGTAGRGVVVAILDRGLDWKNNDFRNPDGTTRIETIFDLTDNTGATVADGCEEGSIGVGQGDVVCSLEGYDAVFREGGAELVVVTSSAEDGEVGVCGADGRQTRLNLVRVPHGWSLRSGRR